MQSTILAMSDTKYPFLHDPEGMVDLETDMPHVPGFKQKPMAVLSIPIVSQEDVSLGSLTVLCKHGSISAFSVEDSTLLNILATSLAACIVADQMERSADWDDWCLMIHVLLL